MIGYTTESALTAYATARGVTLTGPPAVLLIKALDYLESLDYAGERTDIAQALKFPRKGIVLDGVAIDENTVPAQIIKAQHESALAIDAGDDPLAPLEPAVKREKADVVEVEYQDSALSARLVRSISASLKGLLAGGSGIGSFRVTR